MLNVSGRSQSVSVNECATVTEKPDLAMSELRSLLSFASYFSKL